MSQFQLTPALVDWLATDVAGELMAHERCDPDHPVESIAFLRKHVDRDQAAAALSQNRARRAATRKFPPAWCAQLLFDELALEQASSWPIARYKAERLKTLTEGPVADLACGLGADALAMAAVGRNVIAIDRDHVRLRLLEHNAHVLGLGDRIQTRQLTLTSDTDLAGFVAWHCDPDRRPGRQARNHKIEHSEPNDITLRSWLAKHPTAAVKASPGDALWPPPWNAQVEWISEATELKQAMLWSGDFRPRPAAQASRLATGMPRQVTTSAFQSTSAVIPPDWQIAAGELEITHWPPPATHLGNCIYEPDAALIRADLVGLVARRSRLQPVHSRICYLTGDTVDEPSLTRFSVLTQLPGDVQQVRRYLRDNKRRCHEVLCRGVGIETADWQRAFNHVTDRTWPAVSVLVTRLATQGDKAVAIPAERHGRLPANANT